MAYFTRMTTATKHAEKRNVVIMGRKTWDSVPPKFKPFSDRLNIVLSRSDLDFGEYKDVFGCKSLKQAIEELESDKFQGIYEDVWVIGGSSIYKEAMESPNFYRLYLTKVHKHFDCDTFFPPLMDNLKEVSDPDVPTNIQEENGIQYTFHVYETA